MVLAPLQGLSSSRERHTPGICADTLVGPAVIVALRSTQRKLECMSLQKRIKPERLKSNQQFTISCKMIILHSMWDLEVSMKTIEATGMYTVS
jgi:hypothetical protein